MIFLIGAFTVLHIFFYLRLAFGWRRIPKVFRKEGLIPFSVIIPVRNEANTIGQILKHLSGQNYPKDLFEVIVVDDFSDDDTVDQVIQSKDSLDISIRLVQLEDESQQGKKHALTAGVKASAHETIVTTDADCWFGENWIRTYKSKKCSVNF